MSDRSKTTSAAPARRTVICPTCKGPSLYAPENPHRPFCSARCRGIDLGAWASESYRVEAQNASDEPEGSDDLPNGRNPH